MVYHTHIYTYHPPLRSVTRFSVEPEAPGTLPRPPRAAGCERYMALYIYIYIQYGIYISLSIHIYIYIHISMHVIYIYIT